jgi:hypothetical protein
MTQLGWGTSCNTGLEWMKQECRRGDVDMDNVINILKRDLEQLENIGYLCNTLRTPNTKQVREIREYILNELQEEDTSWFYLPMIFIVITLLSPTIVHLFM